MAVLLVQIAGKRRMYKSKLWWLHSTPNPAALGSELELQGALKMIRLYLALPKGIMLKKKKKANNQESE